MRELELKVKKIECTGCENRIKNAIKDIREVKNVDASHINGKVTITLKKELTDNIKNTIISKVENIGFEVEK